MPEPTQDEVNNYLDALRKSGVVNMFAARPYVAERFGVDTKTAGKMLATWMDTFAERHPS